MIIRRSSGKLSDDTLSFFGCEEFNKSINIQLDKEMNKLPLRDRIDCQTPKISIEPLSKNKHASDGHIGTIHKGLR